MNLRYRNFRFTASAPIGNLQAVWIGPKHHKIIGKRLKALRAGASLTQAELAKRLRKPQSFISAYEGGQRRLDFLELTHIALVLGGDPRALCLSLLDEIVPAGIASRNRKR